LFRYKHRENEICVAASSTECRPKSGDKNKKPIVLNCGAVQIFWNDSKN
jgi:hypothetical protein